MNSFNIVFIVGVLAALLFLFVYCSILLGLLGAGVIKVYLDTKKLDNRLAILEGSYQLIPSNIIPSPSIPKPAAPPDQLVSRSSSPSPITSTSVRSITIPS